MCTFFITIYCLTSALQLRLDYLQCFCFPPVQNNNFWPLFFSGLVKSESLSQQVLFSPSLVCFVHSKPSWFSPLAPSCSAVARCSHPCPSAATHLPEGGYITSQTAHVCL